MRTLRSRLHALPQKLLREAQPLFVAAHRLFTPRLELDTIAPVLVLGNQKTGSTAIARLLATLGDLSATTDIPPLQTLDHHLRDDPDAVAAYLQRLRYYFRRDLVKENELTPATGSLLQLLPRARPVFVVRHPAQNIRSILDRVGLPGRPRPLAEIDLSGSGWAPIVTSRPLGITADDHITALAKRWQYMTTLYRRHADRLHLVRYEDFVADKAGTLHALADQLGIPARQDIQSRLDVQFQPRGDHRSVPPEEFFSADALSIIRRQCTDGMETLDYEPIPASASS